MSLKFVDRIEGAESRKFQGSKYRAAIVWSHQAKNEEGGMTQVDIEFLCRA